VARRSVLLRAACFFLWAARFLFMPCFVAAVSSLDSACSLKSDAAELSLELAVELSDTEQVAMRIPMEFTRVRATGVCKPFSILAATSAIFPTMLAASVATMSSITGARVLDTVVDTAGWPPLSVKSSRSG